MNTRSFLLSALIAGLVIGFLGNLPLLNIVNCFLCIFVWIGGILAVFLYGRFQHGQDRLSAGQGAGLGAVAGVIGVFVGMLVYMVTSAITAPLMTSLARALQIQGDMPWSSGGIPGAADLHYLSSSALTSSSTHSSAPSPGCSRLVCFGRSRSWQQPAEAGTNPTRCSARSQFLSGDDGWVFQLKSTACLGE